MWRRSLAEAARGIAQLIFPNTCLICDAPEPETPSFRHGLCSDCVRTVAPVDDLSCPRCALTIGPHTDLTGGCAHCRGESLGFDAAIRLGPYEGRLRDAVLRTKHAAGEGLAEMLGRLLCERQASRMRTEGVGIVAPIPLHWRRRWARGYNQAAAIAREIAAGLGVRYEAGVLRRVRHTPQQVQPSAAARRENVREAFRALRPASLAGQTVLLIDDVMTTGSTAGEAARVLRAAGASRVVAAVLARRL